MGVSLFSVEYSPPPRGLRVQRHTRPAGSLAKRKQHQASLNAHALHLPNALAMDLHSPAADPRNRPVRFEIKKKVLVYGCGCEDFRHKAAPRPSIPAAPPATSPSPPMISLPVSPSMLTTSSAPPNTFAAIPPCTKLKASFVGGEERGGEGRGGNEAVAFRLDVQHNSGTNNANAPGNESVAQGLPSRRALDGGV